jgi:hypothetical protein
MTKRGYGPVTMVTAIVLAGSGLSGTAAVRIDACALVTKAEAAEALGSKDAATTKSPDFPGAYSCVYRPTTRVSGTLDAGLAINVVEDFSYHISGKDPHWVGGIGDRALLFTDKDYAEPLLRLIAEKGRLSLELILDTKAPSSAEKRKAFLGLAQRVINRLP